jgi:hypothetical protein
MADSVRKDGCAKASGHRDAGIVGRTIGNRGRLRCGFGRRAGAFASRDEAENHDGCSSYR